ncbi:MAG: UPF0058 family protein [Archaeoglobaceae archaeon]
MQKEEIILLHLTLYQIRKLLEELGYTSPYFKYYDEMSIDPSQVNRSKLEHKRAIFYLCKGISDIFSTKQPRELVENEKFRALCSIAH